VHVAKKTAKALTAGFMGAVLTSLLIWACFQSGIFTVLGVPVSVPENVAGWVGTRVAREFLWALLFLAPVLTTWPEWQRGLVFGLGPAAVLYFYLLPGQNFGVFGIDGGLMLPLTGLAFSLMWGAFSGMLLSLMRFHSSG